MKKERTYRAFYDDGHDTSDIEFNSCHRANSKANIQDAKYEIRKRYGSSRAERVRISYTVKEEI